MNWEDDPVDATNEFVREARSYCRLIEEPSDASTPWIFARECLAALLRLYLCGLMLPEVSTSDFENIPEGAGYSDWNVIRRQLAERLSRDRYWKVFEPLEVKFQHP